MRLYLHKYFTENEGIVEFELWKRKGGILKCTLKQGKKKFDDALKSFNPYGVMRGFIFSTDQ
jgi:hypothetical protein